MLKVATLSFIALAIVVACTGSSNSPQVVENPTPTGLAPSTSPTPSPSPRPTASAVAQMTCPPKTDPTLELEFWNRRKGRYGSQEVHT